nr:hypothetical protein [uncultured Celeribacter sp.]
MSIHPAIQSLGPKDRFEHVLELVRQAQEAKSVWLFERGDQIAIFKAVETHTKLCEQIADELNVLVATGITEQIADCLSVIYGA